MSIKSELEKLVQEVYDYEMEDHPEDIYRDEITQAHQAILAEFESMINTEILGDLLISLKEHLIRATEKVDIDRTEKRIIALENLLNTKAKLHSEGL